MGELSAERLLAKLGSDSDDALLPVDVLSSLQDCPDVVSLAYYDRREVDLETGWDTVVLHEVVESRGPAGTFIGGTSGASLVSREPEPESFAIQCACLDPDTGRRSLGTTLAHALSILRSKTGWNVQASWQSQAIRTVLFGS